MTTEPREIELSELALDAEIAQALSLAEKFAHEAEYMKWQARREELQFTQEQAAFSWQTDGVYVFHRHVDRKSADKLLHAISRWHQYNPTGDWTILLNSVGGEEYAGYGIIDQLRAHSLRGGGTHRIEMRTSGVAASMGGMMLQAADWRVMGRFSRMMIHKGSVTIPGRITVDEVFDEAEWQRQSTDLMINLYLERTNKITRPEFLRKIARKDWWLSATQTVELGFADVVAS